MLTVASAASNVQCVLPTFYQEQEEERNMVQTNCTWFKKRFWPPDLDL